MTFSLHRGEIVMSSWITRRHLSNIHPLAHILVTCALISVVASFIQFTPTTSCNGTPPPSPCGKPLERGSAGWKNIGTKCVLGKRNWHAKLNEWSTYAPGLSTPSHLSRIVAQPPRSCLCCPRKPSRHPSNLTSVYPVPYLNLILPSTPF